MEHIVKAIEWYHKGDMTFKEVKGIAHVNHMVVTLLPNSRVLISNMSCYPVKVV